MMKVTPPVTPFSKESVELPEITGEIRLRRESSRDDHLSSSEYRISNDLLDFTGWTSRFIING